MTKYTLDENDYIEYKEYANDTTHKLFKVHYTKTFLKKMKLTELDGGYIESEKNLSQKGRSTIRDGAMAFDKALIAENAIVSDHAIIKEHADVVKTKSGYIPYLG